MPAQFSFLNAARINGILQGLMDPRLMPQDLVWNKRIPDVPAVDEEIMARFIGTPVIADLIADDGRAAVYSHGKWQFETNKVPNIKMGISMNQTMLTQLDRIQNGAGMSSDMDFFRGYENRVIEDAKNGVERRKEALKVAMLCDGFSYDRLGIKMSNVTWGMPSDLKVTTAIDWSSTSATPITDINTIRRLARIRYGVEYNRITMSTQAFQYAIATTEFQNQAKAFGFGLSPFPTPTIPLQSDSMLQQILERILGQVTIEMYDARYFFQDPSGLISSAPFLPITKVLLTNSANDGNRNVYDFANGNTTEAMVANMVSVPTMGRLPTGPGPIAYATPTTFDLNAPGLTYWAVARGFPRKQLLQANAVLTVGTFVDTIATTVPF